MTTQPPEIIVTIHTELHLQPAPRYFSSSLIWVFSINNLPLRQKPGNPLFRFNQQHQESKPEKISR